MEAPRRKHLLGIVVLLTVVLCNLIFLRPPSVPSFQQLFQPRITTLLPELGIVDSATGSTFSGEPFRLFQGQRRYQGGGDAFSETIHQQHNHRCRNWAVITTISGPTEAIRRVAGLSHWCTVIVADAKTPTDVWTTTQVYFLSIELQQKWLQGRGKVAAFVASIPFCHFARKNIGYLYAIQQGAQFIFDVDDDNIIDTLLDPIANKTHLENVRVPTLNRTVFNHHKLMGATIEGSWPRGFPLEQIQDEATQGSISTSDHVEKLPIEKIGVLQYCANHDPDVDAVHRLVKPLPMHFAAETATPLLVPKHSFAPYNAQASIHTYSAFWALLLPYTVTGRVSDIWRAYFAEAIFFKLDLAVAFLEPRIWHDRNEHHHLADMQAELDLYFKAGKLIEFCKEWGNNGNFNGTIPKVMEGLWIDLYERGYIEAEDVQAVQLWLEALSEVKYQFPKLENRQEVTA